MNCVRESIFYHLLFALVTSCVDSRPSGETVSAYYAASFSSTPIFEDMLLIQFQAV